MISGIINLCGERTDSKKWFFYFIEIVIIHSGVVTVIVVFPAKVFHVIGFSALFV